MLSSQRASLKNESFGRVIAIDYRGSEGRAGPR